ncbi:hypothetical protein B9G98_01898 [Wickerhamiella sorbophila]|uniref:Letm1 RBD domain-containing protein n=1 Tax=Wickerhamiella sorbophila TaxID=45607 RepID=A0A2T0FH02_9ASCO|nr:hypothetical protein B9G98_01898 [Wickerhamiella sorbophila]PRT54278.1 hypothetical protein B9G98_01898 [Wickerhamiella sorbophila]
MRPSVLLRNLNAPKTLPITVESGEGVYSRAKALVMVYKTGILNVWRNRKVAADIRRRYHASSGLDLAKSVMERSNLYRIQQNLNKVPAKPITVTREELLTVLRTERDWPKLPGFAVLFAVFFELMPILLLAFPRLSPSTCYSKHFQDKIVTAYRHEQAKLQDFKPGFSCSTHQLKDDQARALAHVVLPHAPFLKKYMPISWVRNRLIDHLIIVHADNALLQRDPLETLTPLELEKACMMRALPLGSPSQQMSDLDTWITEFKEPADAGYFFK